MKLIFFGTPEFAVPVLKALIDTGYVVAAVITKPDEPVGRKQILTPPPIKSWIMKHETWNIPILQPKKLDKEFTFQVSSFKPDLIVVAAYGKIIPKEILDIPSHGTLNVHPSLLPKYRGASPIQYAILNGDKETGITIMEIDEEMDHGPILVNSKLPIADSDTYETLSKKLAELGAKLLVKTIPDYFLGKIETIEQDHSKATYTKIIKKEDGKIDFKKSAEEIERMTRAYYPWPTTWAVWRQQEAKNKKRVLKILEIELFEENFTKSAIVDFVKWPVGKVFLIGENNEKKLSVKCGEKSLIIKKLQLEGGKTLLAKDFLNGHRDFTGSVLK